MADPSGYKTFSPGEVLDAAEGVMAYLMDQVVGVYADSSARATAIGTAAEGQVSYLKDTNKIYLYNGSAWEEVGGGIAWSGSTANGLGTYSSSSEIVAESTATYDGTTLQLTTSGGGLKMDGLASSNANTLDDYEEGTWTATISTGGGSITPAAEDTMNYTKIGRLVNVSGSVDGFSVSSPTGAMSVTGLPFAIADTAEKSDRGSCSVTASGLVSAEDNLMGQFNAGGGVVINYGNGGTGGGGAHMATLIDAGSYIRINATYMAAT